MYCKNCGQLLKIGTRFCKNCGQELKIGRFVILKEKLFQWLKDRRKSLLVGSGIIIIVVTSTTFFIKRTTTYNRNEIAASVVNILCESAESDEKVSGGSGTIILKEGIIVTNNHVVSGTTSCIVTIPNPSTGSPDEIYIAEPSIDRILGEQYDIATLEISSVYTDSEGVSWGTYPNTFPIYNNPSNCSDSLPQLGDAIRIYGYPITSGGYNLTITDGIISSFTEDGLILTDAKIDSGNSGGLAVTKNEGCFIGIPSAIQTGNYQNLGVIIPSNLIMDFFNESQDANWGPANTCASGCYFNDKCIPNPPGSYCVKNDPYNAWKCNEGLIELGNLCINCSDKTCNADYPGSEFSYYDEGDDKCVCDCPIGYDWNSIRTACTIHQKTSDEACKDSYGQNSYWTGTYCDCSYGYVWNNNRDECVTRTIACQETWLNSYWDGTFSSDNSKYNCACIYGYVWNNDNTTCVTKTSIDQVCQTKYGYLSYYLGYVEDGKYMCK